jgi:hypothetical protein
MYQKKLMKTYLTQSRRHTKSSLGRNFMLFFPATISNATIPKLYTSALYVKYPHNAYSGAMYPLHKKIILLVRGHWSEATSFTIKQLHKKINLGARFPILVILLASWQVVSAINKACIISSQVCCT